MTSSDDDNEISNETTIKRINQDTHPPCLLQAQQAIVTHDCDESIIHLLELILSFRSFIPALSYEDTGMYTCKAVSEAGETTWSSHLQVEPKSSHVVFYRTPGKGNFPGPPTELTVTEVSETGVRLSWQRNSSVGTSYPHSFVIEYFNLEDGEVSFNNTCSM